MNASDKAGVILELACRPARSVMRSISRVLLTSIRIKARGHINANG